MIKITDRRPILKQVISGICWVPVVLVCLLVVALVGLMIYGIAITIVGGGLLKVVIAIAKSIGITALILAYIIAFLWSNQN